MGKNELEPRVDGGVWAKPGADPLTLLGALPNPAQARSKDINLDLPTLWRIVWEWRWLILSAAAVGLGAAVIITLLTTPLYKSTATLELNPPVVEVMENSKAAQSVANDRTFVATQRGLLESRSLAQRVAQDLNLAGNDVMVSQDIDRAARQEIVANILQKNFSVESDQDSRLIRISYLSPDPALASRIVNGFADGFIGSGLERRYESSSYARDFLQRQIANVRRDLENSERQLVAYAQQQGIILTGSTPEGGAANDANSPTGDTLVTLNRTLAESTGRRIAAEQRYRETLAMRPTAETSERTQALRGQRAALQAEYQDKLNLFQPDYPEMVRLRARIESLTTALAQEEGAVRQGRTGTARGEYQAALAEERELRQRVGELRQDVLDLRGRSIRYTILQRDVDTNRALYEALLQRYKEIGVAGGVGTSLASVVDRGDVPGAPSEPDLLFNLLVGLFLGVGAGLGLALVLEFVNDTVKTPDDVRERLGLAFLGGIPVSKGRAPIEDLRDPTSPVSEAYFSTATALGFTTQHGVPKSLLLTSTRPAEGKSTTTWALAQHFARLGKSVLLIDADLRKPAFVTGDEKEDGLSTVLTTKSSLRPHVIETDFDGLYLLPCGPLPPNPAELLSSNRLREVIEEATREFDMVIVDGPPILGLADSPLLSLVCEATLMVVESGKTRTRATTEALNRLKAAGSNVVGVILTRYRHEATGYGYNYDAYSYQAAEKERRQIRAITSDAA